MRAPANGGVGRRIIDLAEDFGGRSQMPADPVRKADLGRLVKRPKPTADALRRSVQGRDGGYQRPRPTAQALRDSFGKDDIGKDQRYYDPEHRRQRRMGASSTALLVAGGALGARGGRNIARQTVKTRAQATAGAKVLESRVVGPVGLADAQARTKAAGSMVASRKRDLGLLGGAGAAAAGAGTINYQGNHERGKHWR